MRISGCSSSVAGSGTIIEAGQGARSRPVAGATDLVARSAPARRDVRGQRLRPSLARAVALLALALAGCAAPARALPDGSLDGAYVGTRSEDPSCGTQTESVRFDVAGARISAHSRQKHRRLEGTVAADGTIALADPSGGRQVSGSVGGGRLQATEAVSGSANQRHRKSSVDSPTALPCLWRFDAVRAADGPPGHQPE